MENTSSGSDIDFLIVTKQKTLWFTRLLVVLLLALARIPRRKPGESDEKDKLCLNMWIDEGALKWAGKKNIYTAHEIAQILPIIDKGNTHERLITSNAWINGYWPNAVILKKKIEIYTENIASRVFCRSALVLEPLARKLQFLYMKKRITKEKIAKNKAIFHPVDWSSVVAELL